MLNFPDGWHHISPLLVSLWLAGCPAKSSLSGWRRCVHISWRGCIHTNSCKPIELCIGLSLSLSSILVHAVEQITWLHSNMHISLYSTVQQISKDTNPVYTVVYWSIIVTVWYIDVYSTTDKDTNPCTQLCIGLSLSLSGILMSTVQ